MKTFLSLALVIFSLISCVILSTKFGVYQRYPVVHYLMAIVGISYLIILLRKQFSVTRLLAAIASTLMLVFFVLWTLIFSTYGNNKFKESYEKISIQSFSGITLKTSEKNDFIVSKEIEKSPLTMFIFYRGNWWPYCNRELVQLQNNIAEFKKRNVRAVAISCESVEKAKGMKKKTSADFEFLSDENLKLIDIFGLRHKTGSKKLGDIARSATIILDKTGEILWYSVAENYRVRPKIKDILTVIDAF